MNRIKALLEVKTNIATLMAELQRTDPKDAINIADPFWDTECFLSLVNSADEAVLWIEGEIGNERGAADLKENEALPSDGIRTGALIGE